MRYLFIFTLIFLAAAIGCTPYKQGEENKSPFVEEQPGYTLAMIFDHGDKYRERMLGRSGNPSALRYAMEIKDLFFRDRSEPTDRLLISMVGPGKVVWDGKPRSFKKDFPSPIADFSHFLEWHAASHHNGALHPPDPQPYEAVAATFDYLLKFRSKGKTAALVFSEMKDHSPDPVKARKRLVDSLAAFSKAGGHCAFYWLSWETTKELEDIGRDAGLQFGHFVPDAVRDPVRPSFVD